MPINFEEAIPIAVLGLLVNIASMLLLGTGGHDHGHRHSHGEGSHDHPHDDQSGNATGVPGHAHGVAHRDNNLRVAVIHVLADAAVSLLVIVGLLLAHLFGWVWMDPLVGLCGAMVIAVWSFGLIRDTGAILLDMNPDRRMAERMRAVIESDGDRLLDLHLWRLGPGHLGAILSVTTVERRGPDYYHGLLARFSALSHVTVEVHCS